MNKTITKLLATTALLLTALPMWAQETETVSYAITSSKDLALRIGNSNQSGTGTTIEVRENTNNNHEYGFCGIIEFDLTAVQAKIAQGYTVNTVSLRLTDCSNNRSANLAIRPFWSGWSEDKNTTYDANADYIANSIAGDLLTTVSLKRYGGKKAFELQNAGTQVNPFPVSSYQGTSTDNDNLISYVNDSLTAGKTAISFLVGCDDYLGTQGSGFYTKDVLTGLTGNGQCSQYQWSEAESKWVKIDDTDNSITRIAAAKQFFGLTDEQFLDECSPKLFITLNEPAEQSETEVKVMPSVADTWLRMNNKDNHASHASLEISSTKDGETFTKDFVGVMKFNLPSMDGYTIESASLRLVTDVRKGNTTMSIYPFADFNESDIYESHADDVAAARAAGAITTFTVKGPNMQLSSADAITSAYTSVDAWTNTIDITNYVKALNTNYVSIMLENINNNPDKIFTKEAGTYTKTVNDVEYTFKSEDLVPQLIVTLKPISPAIIADGEPVETDKELTQKYIAGEQALTFTVEKTLNEGDEVAATHGTVTLSGAQDGDNILVTITTTPEYGQKLGRLTIENLADPNDVEVPVLTSRQRRAPLSVGSFIEPTDNGDGSYTFTMPENAVQIVVAFAAKPLQPQVNYTEATRTISIENKAHGIGELHYTLNDGTETIVEKNGDIYTNIVITANTTVEAWSFVEGEGESERTTAIYYVAAKPTLIYDEDGNTITLRLTASTATNTSDFKIFYTTDGTTPTTESAYVETETVINITEGMTVVKAFAWDSNCDYSEMVSKEVAYIPHFTVNSEWTAFYSPKTFAVPEGLKAYTIESVTQPAEGNSGTANLVEQPNVYANVPMVLQRTGDTKRFRITYNEETFNGVTAPEFKGTSEAVTFGAADSEVRYILSGGQFLRSVPGTMKAYSCYLEFSSQTAAARYVLSFGSDATGISDAARLNGKGQMTNDNVYDLQGRLIEAVGNSQLSTPHSTLKPGLYIVNGKKIIVR